MVEKGKLEPFVLRKRQLSAKEKGKPANVSYHPILQLWIHDDTGIPVVAKTMSARRQGVSPEFGETTGTLVRGEGTDLTACVSEFGETTVTKQDGEGSDVTLGASSFGETADTRAPGEGSDLDAYAMASDFGETSTLCANISETLPTQ